MTVVLEKWWDGGPNRFPFSCSIFNFQNELFWEQCVRFPNKKPQMKNTEVNNNSQFVRKSKDSYISVKEINLRISHFSQDYIIETALSFLIAFSKTSCSLIDSILAMYECDRRRSWHLFQVFQVVYLAKRVLLPWNKSFTQSVNEKITYLGYNWKKAFSYIVLMFNSSTTLRFSANKDDN